MHIHEIIVVEGHNDTQTLRRFFQCDTIETGGDHVSKETLERIAAAQKHRGVIVFTDPDHAGEHIRSVIARHVPGVKHAYIDKSVAHTDKKVGVEHAAKEDLEKSLASLVSYDNETPSLSWSDFLDLGLIGNARRRQKVSSAFHIGVCNAKICFKRLNQAGITRAAIEEVLHD